MFNNYSNTFEDNNDVSEQLFELVSDDDRKKYVCKQAGCGKFFRYKSEIVRHAATHSESRPFICQYDNCFKAFKRNDALENHIRSSHTKETPFICPFPDCGMKFTTHGSFRYHVLKHNRQNPDGEHQIPIDETIEESHPVKKHVKLNSPSTSASSDNQHQPVYVDPIFKKLGMEDLSAEYYAPPPRFAGEIKWEFVNDDVEAEAPKVEESQMAQLDKVLEENQMLKQKLSTSEQVIKNMQKQINDLLGNLFAYQSQFDNFTPDLQKLPSMQSLNQTFEPAFQPQKEEESMMFDMINYQGGKNLGSPSNVENFASMPENNNLDSFFSFTREASVFDF